MRESGVVGALADVAPPAEAYAVVCVCPAVAVVLLLAGVVSLGFWLARRHGRAQTDDTTELPE